MGNGEHTLELVRIENERIIADMKRQFSTGTCDRNSCVSGFERIFDLIEMLFEINYEKKPAEAPIPSVYIPKSFKEAFLIAATKSPWAIAATAAVAAVYAMFFNKMLPIPGI